jgi:MFS family permease
MNTTESRTSPPAEAGAAPKPRISVHQTFAALKHRNYNLWFRGQIVSLMGTWMQQTAQGYLVFQLTGSPVYLGYVGFAAGVPAWLFTLYGGVIADRVEKRKLLIVTQTAMMLLAFALAALVFSNLVQPWHIVALAFLLGVANAFDAPARLAIVGEMVSREDLTNAIALNATMFNTGTAIGPAVAGVTYALVGPAWCFMLNGVSFVAVIVALLLIKIDPRPAPSGRASAWAALLEGLRYISRDPAIRTLIGLVGVTALFGVSFATLFPAWAVSVLGGDATTAGLIPSARGVGALIGALTIASLGSFKFKGKLLSYGSLAFPLLLLIFAQLRSLPWSLLALLLSGIAIIMIMNVANALVQSLAPDALRGRIMSVYSLTFFGLMPVGALWAGAAAEVAGEPAAVTLGAVVALVFAGGLWVFAPWLRRLE